MKRAQPDSCPQSWPLQHCVESLSVALISKKLTEVFPLTFCKPCPPFRFRLFLMFVVIVSNLEEYLAIGMGLFVAIVFGETQLLRLGEIWK